MRPRVGDCVRVERDEIRYPSRGTWPRFRGRAGTIVEVNLDRKCSRLTEYGVVFGKTRILENGAVRAASGIEITTWFKLHEISAIAPEGRAATRLATASMETP